MEIAARKSKRYADVGRIKEIEVEKLLKQAGDINGKLLFSSVKRHEPNSLEDREGKDFTVSIIVDDKIISRSFGISISRQSVCESRLKHPQIPQMHLPISIKPDTIVKKVLALFTESST